MRRTMRLGSLAGVLALAMATGGCSVSGDPTAEEPATSKATTSTTAPVSPSTVARGDRKATWDDVLEAAGAQHGTVVRSVNAYDIDSGEPITPEFDIELRFDGVQEIAEATIEFPDSKEIPGGGRIEYVFTADHIDLRTEQITGGCGGAWLTLDELVEGLDGGALGDIGNLGRVPMPPFDLVLDHGPVEGSGAADEVAFPFEIPAAMLVSASLQQEDPDHWAKLAATEVPAEVLLTQEGVAIEASAPMTDLASPAQLDSMGSLAESYEMYGRWDLTPSGEPLGLSVPTDVVDLGDDCVED